MFRLFPRFPVLYKAIHLLTALCFIHGEVKPVADNRHQGYDTLSGQMVGSSPVNPLLVPT